MQALVPGIVWGTREEVCLTIFAGLLSNKVVEARKRHQSSTQMESPTKVIESPNQNGLRDAEDERQHEEVSQKRWGAMRTVFGPRAIPRTSRRLEESDISKWYKEASTSLSL